MYDEGHILRSWVFYDLLNCIVFCVNILVPALSLCLFQAVCGLMIEDEDGIVLVVREIDI